MKPWIECMRLLRPYAGGANHFRARLIRTDAGAKTSGGLAAGLDTELAEPVRAPPGSARMAGNRAVQFSV